MNSMRLLESRSISWSNVRTHNCMFSTFSGSMENNTYQRRLSLLIAEMLGMTNENALCTPRDLYSNDLSMVVKITVMRTFEWNFWNETSKWFEYDAPRKLGISKTSNHVYKRERETFEAYCICIRPAIRPMFLVACVVYRGQTKLMGVLKWLFRVKYRHTLEVIKISHFWPLKFSFILS